MMVWVPISWKMVLRCCEKTIKKTVALLVSNLIFIYLQLLS